jgi:UDP-N-acetyl-2-amino-2-deoxyglucuronate dehydrogenase
VSARGTPLRVALVGCGNIAGRHARCLSTADELELALVYDVDRARAAAFADPFGVEACESLEQLLARDDVEACLLCVPSPLHAAVGLRCLAAGKHVLSEKPIDVDLARARELAAEAERRGLVLSVVSQHRFQDGVAWLRGVLASGVLGRVLLADGFSLWKRDQAYYDGRDPAEGGALLNQAVHLVDLVLWLCGPVDGVTGRRATLTHEFPCEDTAVLTLAFRSGALGTLTTSTSVVPQEPERLELRCERGTVVLSGWQVARAECTPGVVLPAAPARPDDPLLPFRRQHADFARAVRGGRAPLVTAEQACDVLALVLDVYRSTGGVRRGASPSGAAPAFVAG